MNFFHSPYRLGIAAALGTTALGVAGDTIIKLIGKGYPLYQVILVNSVAGVFIVLLPLLARQGFSALRTRRLPAHLARAVIGVITVLTYTYCIVHLPLSYLYSLSFSQPLVVTLLAAWLLKEHVTPKTLGLITAGFAGVLMIIWAKPTVVTGAVDWFWGTILALGGCWLYAFSILLVRHMRHTEGATVLSFYPIVTDLLVMPILLLIFGGLPYQGHDLWLNVGAGVLLGVANVSLMQTYKLLPAAMASPLTQYSQLLWGLLFGWLLWNDQPNGVMIAGAAVVIACNVMIARTQPKTETPAVPV